MINIFVLRQTILFWKIYSALWYIKGRFWGIKSSQSGKWRKFQLTCYSSIQGNFFSLKLVCTWGNRGKHSYSWAPSPFLLNGKYLVKERTVRFYAVECNLLIIQVSEMLQDLKFFPLKKKDPFFFKYINQLYMKNMKIRATSHSWRSWIIG